MKHTGCIPVPDVRRCHPMDHQEDGNVFARLHGRALSTGHQLSVGVYNTGRFAITALCRDGTPECRITHNLPDHDLAHGEFHVRWEDRECSPAVFDAIIHDGIARPTGRWVSSGWVDRYAEVWALIP